MTKARDQEERADDAIKTHDTAVQRALVEARQEILQFLQQRLRNRDEAEEVLQRFSVRALERASQLRDVQTMRGWLDASCDHHHRLPAKCKQTSTAGDSG